MDKNIYIVHQEQHIYVSIPIQAFVLHFFSTLANQFFNPRAIFDKHRHWTKVLDFWFGGFFRSDFKIRNQVVLNLSMETKEGHSKCTYLAFMGPDPLVPGIITWSMTIPGHPSFTSLKLHAFRSPNPVAAL